MANAVLKEREVEYLIWNDNLANMKHFCGENCKITYESCCIDDYFLLVVDDFIKRQKVSVALHDYVVKFGDDMFTVVKAEDFDEYFGIVN